MTGKMETNENSTLQGMPMYGVEKNGEMGWGWNRCRGSDPSEQSAAV